MVLLCFSSTSTTITTKMFPKVGCVWSSSHWLLHLLSAEQADVWTRVTQGEVSLYSSAKYKDKDDAVPLSVHYVAPSVLEVHLHTTQDVKYTKIKIESIDAGCCGSAFSLHSWFWLYANQLVFGVDGWFIGANRGCDGGCDKPWEDQVDQTRRFWFQTHNFCVNGQKLQQLQLISVDHLVVRTNTFTHPLGPKLP